MSETETETVERPWHDQENPFEALHDWVKAEFAKLRSEMPKKEEPAAEAPQGKKKWTPPETADKPVEQPAMQHVEAPVVVDAPSAEA